MEENVRSVKKVGDRAIEIECNGIKKLYDSVGLLTVDQNYCGAEIVFGDFDRFDDLIKAELLKDWISLLGGELGAVNERLERLRAYSIPRMIQ